MRGMPLWKLKRELLRFRRQVIAAPIFVAHYYFSTPYYDLVRKKHIRVTDGALPPASRTAIYLIFPQNGLLQSHLRSLSYIADRGYAPLVVSNLPLNDTDRKIIQSKCWQLIERPNFGYDFGGYRDAVLSLRKRLERLDRLVLLNDSTWFPLPDSIDWLREAEALKVDYAAAAWTGAVDYPDPEHFMDIRWNVDKTRRNFHYASFALSISPAILRHHGFRGFWRRFKLTQDKNKTVRRGEIGLTKWMLRRGFTHGATTELLDLPDILRAMPDDMLDRALRTQISLTDPQMELVREEFIRLADAGKVSRYEIEKMVLTSAIRQGASYALADHLVRHMHFPFLKKSPAGMAGIPAQTMVALGRSLPGALGAEICAEIETLAKPVLNASISNKQ